MDKVLSDEGAVESSWIVAGLPEILSLADLVAAGARIRWRTWQTSWTASTRSCSRSTPQREIPWLLIDATLIRNLCRNRRAAANVLRALATSRS
jgi:hypothetical protein